MGSPAIFSGTRTKLLTSSGLLLGSGRTLDYDGARNYISNPNAESDTTGWATYADAAANVPVDGTGGTATNLTFARSTSSPLRDTASFLLTQANSTSLQGKGVSYAFTIDSADQARTLSIRFDYNASSTFIASDGTTAPLNDGTTTTNAGNSDVEVFVYDVTNSALIPVNPQVISGNGANNFSFSGTFQTASNSTSYRLILHVATTSANATGWTFKFDNVSVSSQNAMLSAPVSDWASYTPTFQGFGTVTNIDFWYRRVGDSIQIMGRAATGTVANTEARISLPSGLTIDAVKVPTVRHSGILLPNEVSSTQLVDVIVNGGLSYLNLGYRTSGVTPFTLKEADQFISSSTTFSVQNVLVPVTGWSSTVLMSNEADTRVVAAIAYKSASGSVTADTQINYDTVLFDTHGAVTTGASWKFTAPVSGFYRVSPRSSSSSGTASVYISKNGTKNEYAYYLDGSSFIRGASVLMKLVAGDYIDVRPDGTSTQTGPSGGAPTTEICIERVTGPASIAVADAVNARYYASSTSISGSLATVVWTTKDYDSMNAMSSGVYTVPISGKYQVQAALAIAGTLTLNNTSVIEIQKNGTAVSNLTRYVGGAITQDGIDIEDCVNCVAGDTLRIQVSSSGTLPTIVSSNTRNYVSIFRIGN